MATIVPQNMVATVCMAFNAFRSQDVSNSLEEENNQNLSQAQKELLQWHWKLAHFISADPIITLFFKHDYV